MDIYDNIARMAGVSRHAAKRVVLALMHAADDPPPELAAARRIAADQSKQTGKNYQNFIGGAYDHAYGVRCAKAGIAWARTNEEK